MNKKTLRLFLSLFIGFIPLVAVAVALSDPLGGQNIGQVITGITKVVAGVIGGASTIMISISGILFLTSGGDPGRLQTAKTCLTYAIIGGTIALAAAGLVTQIQGIVQKL